jgi:hypothetical protein
MGMEQSTAVRQIAKELNGGSSSGRGARLAHLMGASVATVRSWGAAGLNKGRKRVTSPSARRLLFLLLALHRDGHNLDRLRSSARRLEREYLDDEDDDD